MDVEMRVFAASPHIHPDFSATIELLLRKLLHRFTTENTKERIISMKRIIAIAALFTIVALTAFAQDEDSSGYSNNFRRTKSKVGGAGGFTPAWGLFKFDEINKVLDKYGLPKIPTSGPMYLAGGEGYGYIMFLKNVRIGGKGMAGTISSTTYDPMTNTKKNVDYRISYGGFLVDYVLPLGDRLDVSVGLALGGGSVDITMNRDNGSFKQWDSLWTEFGTNAFTKNTTQHLNGSFFALQPSANIEYAILRWFQIRVGVTYPLMFNASWKLENDKEILSVPNNLKPDGPVITAGIMFGFFN
jgi:hypothetical protein